jgi:hypothetical protein
MNKKLLLILKWIGYSLIVLYVFNSLTLKVYNIKQKEYIDLKQKISKSTLNKTTYIKKLNEVDSQLHNLEKCFLTKYIIK